MQSSTPVHYALCTPALLCTPVHSVHSALCTEHMHPSALQYTVYMHLLYSLLLLQCTQYTQYCCYAVQMKGLTAVIVHCAVYTNTNIKVQKYKSTDTRKCIFSKLPCAVHPMYPLPCLSFNIKVQCFNWWH